MNRRPTVLRETLTEDPPAVEGRTIDLRVATYDRIYDVGPRKERVRPGAFKDALSRPRALLRWRHGGERPGEQDSISLVFGEMRALREQGNALHGTFEVFDGPERDVMLRLVKSGTVTGVSLAAVIREERPVSTPAGVVYDILRFGTLDGVSITPTNAYDDAEVLAVRDVTRAAVDAERAFWANLRNVR